MNVFPYRRVAVLLLLVVGMACKLTYDLAYDLARAPLLVDLANQKSARDQERAADAKQAAATLQAATARGDALATQLLQQEQQVNQLSKEKRNAIPKVTSGRACLDGPALRLLDTAPGLSVADLPEAASGAAAAGGRTATDTNVAQWAIDAGAQYEICRHRLDGLIDFYQPALPAPLLLSTP